LPVLDSLEEYKHTQTLEEYKHTQKMYFTQLGQNVKAKAK